MAGGQQTNHFCHKAYELPNHLGNVLATVSDRKWPVFSEPKPGKWQFEHFQAELLSASEYYPFGMEMPGRIASSESYRYGFQGQEKDDEIKGPGNSINYKYRMHDPRMGRFLSVDPLAPEYPWNSPYAFSENKVIQFVELEGLEVGYLVGKWLGEITGYQTVVDKMDAWGVSGQNRSLVIGYAGFASIAAGMQMSIDIGGTPNMAVDYWMGIFDVFMSEETDAFDVAKVLDPTGTLGLGEIFAKATGATNVSDDEVAYARGQAAGIVAAYLAAKRGFKGKGPKPRCFCFTEDTWVLTDSSLVKIPEIQVGDQVWAFDDSNGEIALKPVTRLFTYQWHEVYQIYLDTTLIEATHEHPFFVQGEWIDAEDLAVGDTLTRYDGKISVIDSIHLQTGSFQVYNFEVEEYHSYFVTEQGVLVHNCPDGPTNRHIDGAKAELRNFRNQNKSTPLENLKARYQKSIDSYNAVVEEHKNLISDPQKYMKELGKGDWDSLDPRQQNHLLTKKWPEDIKRAQAKADVFREALDDL